MGARGGNPDEVKESQRARFADEGIVDEIIALDDICRTAKYTLDNLKKEKNEVSKQYKGADAKKKEELGKRSKEIGTEIAEQEKKTREALELAEKKLKLIGNIVAKDVVISKDEANNQVVRTWGKPNKDLVVD